MKLTSQQLSALKRMTEDLDGEVRTTYSGRGMFGKECLGVAGEFKPFQLGLALGADDELRDIFQELRTCEDQMGLGIILYWPDLTS
jgi:hypothetical protein